MQQLMNYSWPGNIRELRNVLEGALILCKDEIHAGSLRLARCTLHSEPALRPKPSRESMQTAMREVECLHIENVLCETNWNVRSAALTLGIPRSSLYQRIKELRIVRQEPVC
jgi:DNA-binding NtrC family response regulator